MASAAAAPLELDTPGAPLAAVIAQIAARAQDYDRAPRWPGESMSSLREAGVPQLAGRRGTLSFAGEVALIRVLAAGDASVARILDGHFNGAERIALCAPPELRDAELAAIREQGVLLGVWGADPAPGEGEPASVRVERSGTITLTGVKTFCSGAGGVERALVVARDELGARRLAYLDVTSRMEIDRGWYRASGLRASESHRVEFQDAPVLALLGGANELAREPWLSRDSVRTAATWAGIADGIFAASLEAVAGIELDQLRLHALGRMRLAQASIDRWLAHTAEQLEQAPAGEAARLLAGQCRVALADAARAMTGEAVRVSGSRALIGRGPLDRARRDLDLFLLQHRLDPVLVELGSSALAASRG